MLSLKKIGKEHILVVVGLIESFFYSGLVFGWATLNFLLKKEGVFSHLCTDTGQGNETAVTFNNHSFENVTLVKAFYINNLYQSPVVSQNETIEVVYLSCDEQSKMLNLAYNIAVSAGAFTGFFWGLLLDRFGIRALRLGISFCISGGALLLMFTSKDLPYMLFIGMTLCSLVGIAIRLSCLQIAELFPRQRSTLISLYSGANTASAAVFTLLKYFYDNGLSWTETIGIYLALTLLALPFTLLLFPVRNFNKIKDVKFGPKGNAITESVEQLDKAPAKTKVSNDPQLLPLTFSVFSFNSLLYNFWFAWLMLYTLYYNGSLHLWAARTSNNPDDLNTYVDILGVSQLGAMILGPMTGFLIDFNLSRVPKPKVGGAIQLTSSGDGGDYHETVSQIRATFWMALLTTSMLAGVEICKFFNTPSAIICSMVFFILYRSSVMGISITYLRQRFPLQHFNKLVGITATFRGFTFLLQFVMFIWDTNAPLQISIFNMVCLAVAFILPIHIITPLLPALMKREDKVAKKIQYKNLKDSSIIANSL